MGFDLEIYQGRKQRYIGNLGFDAVLQLAGLQHFGDVPEGSEIEIRLKEPTVSEPYAGPPEIRNLSGEVGHCVLSLIKDGETLREDRLRIVDLFGPVLAEQLVRVDPNEQHWGFRLRHRLLAFVLTGTGIRDRLTSKERLAPELKGAVEVDLGEQAHRPFTLTPLASADVELVSPEVIGLEPSHLSALNILMPARIHDQILRKMPLADRMEEGGFLLGRISRASEQAFLVEITHVTPAHHSGAGLVHFTFTGESFLAVAQLLEKRNLGEQLVGWYHTHLPAVDFGLGLSSIDVDLHMATFQQPWQVAALINIRKQDRVLRFYGRAENGLKEYNQWISDDSGRYRPAGRSMGGG